MPEDWSAFARAVANDDLFLPATIEIPVLASDDWFTPLKSALSPTDVLSTIDNLWAKRIVSVSGLNASTETLSPLYDSRLSDKTLACSSVTVRGSRVFAIFRRAIFSLSRFAAKTRFCFRNPSASFSSLAARSSASAALLIANPAWRSASAALPFAIATNFPVTSLISVSTLPALMCMQNSPATPIATRPAPKSPQTNNRKLGLSGGRIIPRENARLSCRYSMPTTTTSMATPTTTNAIQNINQWSSDPHADSRLFSSLKRADSSMAKFYRDADRWMTFQIVAMVCLFLGAIGSIIIPEWFSQYKIHKLTTNRQNKA